MAAKKPDGRPEEPDEDALVTMVDRPISGFSDDEDDSDMDSTQLEWVSPLNPSFGEGKPPPDPEERFPADEPNTPRPPPPELDGPPAETEAHPSEAEEAEEDATDIPTVVHQDLDLGPLLPDETDDEGSPDSPPPVAPSPPASPRASASPATMQQASAKPPSLSERPLSREVPSLDRPRPDGRPMSTSSFRSGASRRRSSDAKRASSTDSTFRMVATGLVAGVVLALLVLALAASWWLSMR